MDDEEEYKNYTIRRFLYKIKPRFLDDYLLFYQARRKVLDHPWMPTALINDIRRRSKSQTPIYLKDLKIGGNEVVTHLSIDKSKAPQRELIGIILELLRERVEVKPAYNSKKGLYAILDQIKEVKSLCTGLKVPKVNIISTDHVRKLYRMKNPDYSSWESAHTYQLAIWLVSCLLRRNKSCVVIFDGTNFNSPSHPKHREKLIKKFASFNPLFVHTSSTKDDLDSNFIARNQEEQSISKSDADITVHQRYETLLESYENSLHVPANLQVIELSTRSEDYGHKVAELILVITKKNHRLIIMSGNVLTGKTFTANKIKQKLIDIS